MSWEDEAKAKSDPVDDWEAQAISQSVPQDDPRGSGGPLQGLKDLAGFAMRQVDRVSAGPLRGAEQGIQDYNPQGGGFHPGVIGAALKGAGRGFMNPDQVQPGQQMFSRMGVSDAPTSRLNVMGTSGQPMNLGQGRPAGDPSTAATLGALQDMIAPLPPVGLALKGGLNAGAKIAKAGERMGISAAEKAILEHYNPTLMKEFAPADGGVGTIANAPKIVAEKLKEHDLLYNPSKAHFNMQRDIRKTGEQIGSVIEDAKQKDLTVNVQGVFNDFLAAKKRALTESGQGAESAAELESDIAPRIQAMIDQLHPNEMGHVPIDKAVNFRRALQQMVKNWGDQAGKPIIQGAAKDLQGGVNKAIELSDPKYGPKLAGLNNKFSDLMELQPLIEDAYTRNFGKAAAGKKAAGLKDRVVESLIGENGKPMVKSLVKAAASPAKTLAQWLPEGKMEALANRGRRAYPDMYASSPLTQAPTDLLDAIKKPFVQNQAQDLGGLPARQPVTARRPLDAKPATYVPQPNDAARGLPARQVGNASPGRRPLSPIADDPSLSVEQLGKVMDADAAKEIAAGQYQSDRLKTLWQKVRESKSTKQRAALMNLIRAVHRSTGK